MKFPAFPAALALSLFSTALHAEWRPLAEASIGRISYDTNSVRKQGGKTQFQYRIDFTNPVTDPVTKKAIGSTIVNVAVDCTAKTVTLLSSSAHGAAEGRGEVISRNVVAAPAPEPVNPDSSNHSLWQVACQPPAAAAPPAAPAKPAKK